MPDARPLTPEELAGEWWRLRNECVTYAHSHGCTPEWWLYQRMKATIDAERARADRAEAALQSASDSIGLSCEPAHIGSEIAGLRAALALAQQDYADEHERFKKRGGEIDRIEAALAAVVKVMEEVASGMFNRDRLIIALNDARRLQAEAEGR